MISALLAFNAACVTALQMANVAIDDNLHLEPALVSAIVPTCNRAGFLSLALQQIAAQDYPLIEVIVVDDSVSEYEQIPLDNVRFVDKLDDMTLYEYPRSENTSMEIKYVRLHGAASIGQKRNDAVRAADGAYIIHWDDDDMFPSTRISSQVLPLIQRQARMTVLEHKYFFESSRQEFLEHNEMHQLPTGEVVRYNDFFSKGHGALFLGTLAYERSVADEVGGYERVSKGEDIRFIEAALQRCVPLLNVRGVPNVYVRHNNTPSGVHNTWTFSKLEQHLMYDHVHRVDAPPFVTAQAMQLHRSAELRATEQGRCVAPSSPVSEFSIKYFPEMPAKCCNSDSIKPGVGWGLGCEKLTAPDIVPMEENASLDAESPVDHSASPTAENVVAAEERVASPAVPIQENASGETQQVEAPSQILYSDISPQVILQEAQPPVGEVDDLARFIGSAVAQDTASVPFESVSASIGNIHFDEEGYQAVLKLKTNGKMGEFIRGYLKSTNREVSDMDAFRKFVPNFSGMREQGTTFQMLQTVLDAAPFVKKSGNNETAVPK
eukprot:TRINITY_DN32438_c0_g1_i1.p1 TRINITY_DN32438_c0_g1~~TRINITY_DN32438_c0_g1_i1.p1  ORF type:complete len:575 (+),score=101.24 TRINITY_DN32438_c0_g1_i1:76-1725(+)